VKPFGASDLQLDAFFAADALLVALCDDRRGLFSFIYKSETAYFVTIDCSTDPTRSSILKTLLSSY
jgi:hypothetical protein